MTFIFAPETHRTRRALDKMIIYCPNQQTKRVWQMSSCFSTMVTSVFSTLCLKVSVISKKFLSKTTVTHWPPSCSSRLQRQRVQLLETDLQMQPTSMWMFIPTRLYTMVTSRPIYSAETQVFFYLMFTILKYWYFVRKNGQFYHLCYIFRKD